MASSRSKLDFELVESTTLNVSTKMVGTWETNLKFEDQVASRIEIREDSRTIYLTKLLTVSTTAYCTKA